MNGWGYGLMTLVIVGFVILIVLLAVMAYHRLGDRPPVGGHQVTGGQTPEHLPDPEKLLAERYSRGEIDDDEYRRRLKVLRDQD